MIVSGFQAFTLSDGSTGSCRLATYNITTAPNRPQKSEPQNNFYDFQDPNDQIMILQFLHGMALRGYYQSNPTSCSLTPVPHA